MQALRSHQPCLLDDVLSPELVEVLDKGLRKLRRVDSEDDVLLPRPGVVGPVHRPGPDGLAVSNDELVVHQVRHAADSLRRHP